MRKAIEQIITTVGETLATAVASRVEAKEGHGNFVTDMDVMTQQLLYERLHALCPQACFIGEEQENEKLDDRLTWVVDPIDGTTNFIHDAHFSAISIALLKDRRPMIGCVYQPFTRQLFSAELGKGAWLNGQPMQVTAYPPEKALVAFGTSPYQLEFAKASMDIAFEFLTHFVDIRRSGSAALDLAYLAAGRHDVFFELNLKPWDYAAGSLLVTEAGGKIAMPMLTEPDYDRYTTILAANPLCFDAAERILQEGASRYGITQERMDIILKRPH